jgi:plastocyanin
MGHRPIRGLFASVIWVGAVACGGSTPATPPTSTVATTTPTASPSPCATVAPGPAPLCAPVNDGGRADVTDQGSSVALEIETPGMRFTPTYILAEPGADVTVTLVNTQTAIFTVHTLHIDSLNEGALVDPGETATLTFTLPTDVAFVPFYCAAGGRGPGEGHRGLGMQGAFYFG